MTNKFLAEDIIYYLHIYRENNKKRISTSALFYSRHNNSH